MLEELEVPSQRLPVALLGHQAISPTMTAFSHGSVVSGSTTIILSQRRG
jgi:hypothetical protein